MHEEKVIHLDKFVPRDYQLPVFKAVQEGKFKKFFIILPRRGGKDLLCWNIMIHEALRRKGNYYYLLPKKEQSKTVIFNSITNSGDHFIDYIPPEIRVGKPHKVDLSFTLINGSYIKLLGGANWENLKGMNPQMLVLSEFAYFDDGPNVYQNLIIPILRGNPNCKVIIQSTPNGKNYFYDLYNVAQRRTDEWFVYSRDVTQTKHMDVDEIQRDIETGEITWERAQQEYYLSFDIGIEGSYYSRYLQKAYHEDRITNISYDSEYPVNCAWDLGWNDCTSIIFFQVINNNIYIIDFYENHHKDITHYIKYVKEQDYIYGIHILPHDVEQGNQITGTTRLDKFKDHNLKTEVLPRTSVHDGIDAVRNLFRKIYIDEKKCAHLIKCLDNYRKEYDRKRKTYYDKPVHDWASDAADAMRYLAMGWRKAIDSDTVAYEQYNKAWQDSRRGFNRSIYSR